PLFFLKPHPPIPLGGFCVGGVFVFKTKVKKIKKTLNFFKKKKKKKKSGRIWKKFPEWMKKCVKI
ncbi:hypothetical protein C4M87_02165, partial [Mycoplasmopsis pullorum]|uniref:hypothetical protein n=1 Tax=Mycoplasmopsis pullorum TaxID=48003 RepID=UPI001C58E2EC